jgi:hypothetical protein
MWQFCITVVMQCISRHLTLVESALCCSCLEPLFSLGSQTACTQCTFSTLPGVIVPGTGSQPSYTASSEQAPIHFTAENSMSGTVPDPVHDFLIQIQHFSSVADPKQKFRIRFRIWIWPEVSFGSGSGFESGSESWIRI